MEITNMSKISILNLPNEDVIVRNASLAFAGKSSLLKDKLMEYVEEKTRQGCNVIPAGSDLLFTKNLALNAPRSNRSRVLYNSHVRKQTRLSACLNAVFYLNTKPKFDMSTAYSDFVKYLSEDNPFHLYSSKFSSYIIQDIEAYSEYLDTLHG